MKFSLLREMKNDFLWALFEQINEYVMKFAISMPQDFIKSILRFFYGLNMLAYLIYDEFGLIFIFMDFDYFWADFEI